MPGSVKGDVSAVEPVIYKGVRYETIENLHLETWIRVAVSSLHLMSRPVPKSRF
jgi:hypothetical protein